MQGVQGSFKVRLNVTAVVIRQFTAEKRWKFILPPHYSEGLGFLVFWCCDSYLIFMKSIDNMIQIIKLFLNYSFFSKRPFFYWTYFFPCWWRGLANFTVKTFPEGNEGMPSMQFILVLARCWSGCCCIILMHKLTSYKEQ